MSIVKWLAHIVTSGVLTMGAAFGVLADSYQVEKLVPGSAFHGVHGLAFDHQGKLYAGSVTGQALYRVAIETGEVTTEIGTPRGMADDIAFAPDGTMAWTGFMTGDLYARKEGGAVRKLASGLPGLNSLAYRADGRLYATQVFLGDALYEIDTGGVLPPRKILENLGGLNGFQFGPDDKLYGPLWFKGQVVRIDVDTAAIDIVAEGFKVPAAVNLDSRGNIWVVDTALGQLIKVERNSGAKTVVAQLDTALDNLAIDARDRVYVSNMADNGIQEVDPRTGEVRQVVKGSLAMPGGIALFADDDAETLYVADTFAFRAVDTANGTVRDIARMQADPLEYPMNVSATAERVILSGWFTGSVQVFDRRSGESLDLMHDFDAPQDAVVLDDNSLLVAELGTGNLVKASGKGGATRTVLASGLIAPVGLAMAGSDVVYVTEAGAGRVSRVDLASGARTVIVEGLSMPEGIAVAPGGHLVVAEVGARRVIAVEADTGEVAVLAGGLPIGLSAAEGTPPSYVPTGVAVGRGGAVYLTSDIENAIYRLTPR